VNRLSSFSLSTQLSVQAVGFNRPAIMLGIVKIIAKVKLLYACVCVCVRVCACVCVLICPRQCRGVSASLSSVQCPA
jgi:hypothetical protein